jgi:hypothetical protein
MEIQGSMCDCSKTELQILETSIVWIYACGMWPRNKNLAKVLHQINQQKA